MLKTFLSRKSKSSAMKQVFNHDQAVVLTHQLSQRCFSRVIIFARSQPRSITRELLTETETDGLVATLLLLASIYSDLSLRELGFVVLGEGTITAKLNVSQLQ